MEIPSFLVHLLFFGWFFFWGGGGGLLEIPHVVNRVVKKCNVPKQWQTIEIKTSFASKMELTVSTYNKTIL